MDEIERKVKAAHKAALVGCVERMKGSALRGKPRDDAAAHYFAGVVAALRVFNPMLPEGSVVDELGAPETYLDVLEQLAATAED